MRLSLALLFLLGAASGADSSAIRLVVKTKYLNNALAIVAHTTDDSTKYVTNCIDAMDKYRIKATIFVSTEQDPAPEDRFFNQLQVRELWPRLRQAVENGHEIGSHSRQHPCKRPDTEAFCSAAYNDYEVTGSRDDILRLTRRSRTSGVGATLAATAPTTISSRRKLPRPGTSWRAITRT